MAKYFILMGDIINSRKINSDELWNNFNEVINNAKIEFSKSIKSSLEIKIGDEFQVVIKDIDSLLSLLFYLDVYFRYKNIDCRFAIGYGEISGDINKKSSYNMIGNGLTYTNQLLNQKKSKYTFYIQNNIERTSLLNIIGILLEDTLSTLTKKQIQYLYYKEIEHKSIDELELKMETVKRNLYRYREKSKYSLIKKVFTQITNIFKLNEEELKKEYFKDIKFDEKN